MRTFYRNIRQGIIVGIIFGWAFLLCEDLWAWTVLRAEFTVKQVLFSLLLYVLLFGIVGALSGALLLISPTKEPKRRENLTSSLLTMMAAFVLLYLTYPPVAAFLIRFHGGLLPASIPKPLVALFVSPLYVVGVLLLRVVAVKLLAKGKGGDAAVLLLKTIVWSAVVCVSLLLTLKTNADFFRQDIFARYHWWWRLETVAFTVAVFFWVRSVAGKIISGLPDRLRPGWTTIIVSTLLLLVFWVSAGAIVNHHRAGRFVTVSAAHDNHPRVILILIDALRADHMSLYGYQRNTTPFLDQYSSRGAVFTDAAAHSSWTKPSVSSLFSSWYLGMHKVNGFTDYFPDQAVTISEVLSDQGYYTRAISANPMIVPDANFDQGFDDFQFIGNGGQNQLFLPYSLMMKRWRILSELAFQTNLSGYPYATATQITDEIIPWMEDNRDKQYFVYLHFMEPHDPYVPRRRYYSAGQFLSNAEINALNLTRKGMMPDEAAIQKAVNRYDDEIINMDQQLGVLFRAMDEMNVWDNTLVILTSDHGEEFYEHGERRHGHWLFEESVHVPLVLFFPSGQYAGMKIDDRVDLLDIAPTIYDYLQLTPEGNFVGTSLLPLLREQPDSYHQAKGDLFGQLTWNPGTDKTDVYSITRTPYKFIETTYKVPEVKVETALFNLEADPSEQVNVVDDFPALAREFETELVQYKAYCDSLGVNEQTMPKLHLNKEDLERLRALGYVN